MDPLSSSSSLAPIPPSGELVQDTSSLMATFQPPPRQQESLRLLFTSPSLTLSANLTTSGKKKFLLSTKLRLLKLHRISCRAVQFPGYLVKLLTFPLQPARQNNKPSDRHANLHIFYSQALTQILRALLIGSEDFQKVRLSLGLLSRQEVCNSWAGDRGKGVSGAPSQ